jgi:hypothetical protein
MHFARSTYALEFDFNFIHGPNKDDNEYIQSLSSL